MNRLDLARALSVTVMISALPTQVLPEPAARTRIAVAQGVAAETAVGPYLFQPGNQIGIPGSPSAAVYTPFVRVAMAARVARDNGRTFDPEDAPEWITAPLIYVVFRSPCPVAPPCTLGTFDYAGQPPDLAAAWTEAGSYIRPGPDALAQELIHDLSFLDAIGGLPFEHAVVAAAFQPEQLREGVRLIARWKSPGVIYDVGGHVTREELRQWR